MKGYTYITDNLWYCNKTGKPYSSRRNSFKLLTSKSRGYFNVRVGDKILNWHVLIWKHFNGEIPEGMTVDHRNNNRTDNRLENLCLKSGYDNCCCRLKQKNSKTGFAGVSETKWGKFKATITVNRKPIHLGYFFTAEEAYKEFIKAKIKYHGEESIRVLERAWLGKPLWYDTRIRMRDTVSLIQFMTPKTF